MNTIMTRKGTVVQDPPIAQALFNDTRSSILWLVLRIYIGYQWFEAGMHKMENPEWTQTGLALKGFWEKAVLIPETGRAAITYDWYRSFLQFLLDNESYVWFAKLIAYGEFLVGVALIIGLFTGIAAFLGSFMNWNFIMAGSASSNGYLFSLSVLLILAWKVAGYIGVDYFLLPYLGTPWREKPVEPKPATA